ncbi:MAG: putative Zn-dependent hydrolase of beta-lactamase fold [Candidatus Atelocyanobacterium thalassa isolate SIO64986]|uniref:Putative Zn-dependent hydrolase of beta-lactamase fold n=1 Tax=Candidatus Atelocyanobacterium thalassa isolate SIO64986 TaxID=1527444 RepID=A0A086CGE4_9CHRO|nr:MAG: putative Zn-dependent hydrolase of beta-lactamase fold [Candidatus Atelocyanobacterium thalassa isolate SIO64986]
MMKRRQFITYSGISALFFSKLFPSFHFSSLAAQETNSSTLSIKYLGHTCFLFSGGGLRVLVNPFLTIGCTAGYRLPNVEADLVITSSHMWDEGAADGLPGTPRMLHEPGVYKINGLGFQGISIDHDRKGGKQFGNNVAWRWTQAGMHIVHLGGAAAPIDLEQKILLGNPDIACIPVGGGPKAYNAVEGRQAMQVLNPKIMIPTHYRTSAADTENCDIDPLNNFLELEKSTNIKKIHSDQLSLTSKDLPQQDTHIYIFDHESLLVNTRI